MLKIATRTETDFQHRFRVKVDSVQEFFQELTSFVLVVRIIIACYVVIPSFFNLLSHSGPIIRGIIVTHRLCPCMSAYGRDSFEPNPPLNDSQTGPSASSRRPTASQRCARCPDNSQPTRADHRSNQSP